MSLMDYVSLVILIGSLLALRQVLKYVRAQCNQITGIQTLTKENAVVYMQSLMKNISPEKRKQLSRLILIPVLLPLLFMFGALIVALYEDIRVNYFFKQTLCTIEARSIESRPGYPDFLYTPYFRVNFMPEHIRYHYIVMPTLSWDRMYFAQSKALESYYNYQPGLIYTCWYNPKAPSQVVLEKSFVYSEFRTIMLVFIVFIIVFMVTLRCPMVPILFVKSKLK